MRFTTIRARVGLISAVLAVALVSGVALSTYFVVATQMLSAAHGTSDGLVDASEFALAAAAEEASVEAERRGLRGAERDAFIASTISSEPPPLIAGLLGRQAKFTLYVAPQDGGETRAAWSVGDASVSGTVEGRRGASAAGERGREVIGGHPVVMGLLLDADLGHQVSYLPVDVPGMDGAVLEIGYEPRREEEIIDSTRPPMIAVAVFSVALALLVMNLSTKWTLALVRNLRTTADSIDVGQLDVELPEEGENEVAELARSLNRLISSLRRRNEAQARFIADASHELATPVAGIRGYVNILRAWGAEDPALREEAVSAIDRESRRMARLCSNLLSVIRNEELIEYRQVRYDINATCREVLANAATRYFDKHLDFSGPDEGPLWLYGDPDRIEEALGILVDNACKFTPGGGKVSVTTRRHRDHVMVDIIDTGVGIPDEDLPNIFDRFYRSDVSRSKETGGFGLGLAIAKHIVSASGAEISVRSRLGAGTTFTVSLPRHKGRP